MNFEQFESVDGLEFRYVDIGKGDTLVLLHGFGLTHRIFEKIMPPIAEGFRVVALDLPGHGGSEPIPGMHSLENVATWVNRALQVLDVNDFILAGHSMGGYIALAYAEQYAWKLRGLSLMHSVPGPDDFSRRVNRNKTIQFIEKYGIYEFAKVYVPSLFCGIRPDLVAFTFPIVEQSNPLALVAFLEAMRDRRDRRSLVSNLRLPMLNIVGKEDPFIPYRQSSIDSLLSPSIQSIFLDIAGHMSMMETPDPCADALLSFLFRCYKIEGKS